MKVYVLLSKHDCPECSAQYIHKIFATRQQAEHWFECQDQNPKWLLKNYEIVEWNVEDDRYGGIL